MVLSHGHGDHHAGAKYLQDKFGPRLIAGGPDWDLMERDARKMRGERPFVFTNLKTNHNLDVVVRFIETQGLLAPEAKRLTA